VRQGQDEVGRPKSEVLLFPNGIGPLHVAENGALASAGASLQATKKGPAVAPKGYRLVE
jgi:hypothetical protein